MSDKLSGYHEEVVELSGTNQKDVLYALADHSGLKSNASFRRRGSDHVDDGELVCSTYFATDIRDPSQIPHIEVGQYWHQGRTNRYFIRIKEEGYNPGEIISALKKEFGAD